MLKMRALFPLLAVAGIGLAGCVAPPPPPPPPPPMGVDLVATDIAWPVPLLVGQRVPFSVTVQNVGDTATPANTILDVLVSVDGVDTGWSDNITVPLAPGASRVQVVNGGPNGSDGLWTVTAGSHSVQAYVNSGSLPARPPIAEYNRDNNKLVEPFEVKPPGRTDQIVYSGTGGIWTMHSDATGVHQLTNDGGFSPDVSRDGRKIAYLRSFPAGSGAGFPTYTHIWVMNADGSDQHEVFVAPPISAPCGLDCVIRPPYQQPADTIRDQSPSWSPDGTEIAFVRRPVNLVYGGVLVMNADGTGIARTIVANPNGDDRFLDAAWSPDGATIAASYDYVCGSTHIQLYAADGSGGTGELLGLRFCGDDTTTDLGPNWSPDASRIAFSGVPNLDGMMDGGPIGVNGTWIANVSDPPSPILLAPFSPATGAVFNPSYSPDGTRIAFSRNGTIWTMNASPGSEGTDQDDTHVPGGGPSWGP